jgi:hypothetical protein
MKLAKFIPISMKGMPNLPLIDVIHVRKALHTWEAALLSQ